jgi:hypothetical protein
MCVLDYRVETQSTSGWTAMGSITSNKDVVIIPVLIGDHPFKDLMADVKSLQIKLWKLKKFTEPGNKL